MITPGLFRRALRRSAQWRLLLIALLAAAIPALLAMFPLAHFLGSALDHHPRAKQLVSSLDTAVLLDLIRLVQQDPAPDPFSGVQAALVIAVLIGPFVAGAAAASARSDEVLETRELLRGGGEFYGRYLRMLFVAIIPLGLAGGIAAGLGKLLGSRVSEAISESSMVLPSRIVSAIIFSAFLLAQLTLDLGRGMIAAQPERRSALLAWWSGLGLLLRRPVRAIGLGLVTTLCGLGLAALVMVLRQRIPQTSSATVVSALLLAQLGSVAISWARAARLFGFAELVRADAADRRQRPAVARFEMEPPKTSPPPVPAPSIAADAPPVAADAPPVAADAPPAAADAPPVTADAPPAAADAPPFAAAEPPAVAVAPEAAAIEALAASKAPSGDPST